MTLLNRFRQAVNAFNRPSDPVYLNPVIFTRGKWVIVANQVGIISDTSEAGYFIVDLVDPQGITVSRGRCEVGSVRLARRDEIPEPRRPSVELGQSLGYN
jgi:hypothetical protein